jgi:hypothetical protein
MKKVDNELILVQEANDIVFSLQVWNDIRDADLHTSVCGLMESSGVEVESCARFSQDEIFAIFSRSKAHIVYFTDGFYRDFSLFKKRFPSVNFERVLIVLDTQRELIQDQPQLTEFNHVLSSSPQKISHQFILSTVQRLRSRDFFGLDKFLLYGAHVHSHTMKHSDERSTLRESLHAFVLSLSSVVGRPTDIFAQFALEVQDELLMNALWDANPKHSETERKGSLALQKTELVQVQWGFDGLNLALGVKDPFGTFAPEVIKKYLLHLFSPSGRKNIKIRQDGHGAGIGLFMVLERLSSLSITVESRCATEVVATFNLMQNPRQLGRSTRSFQYFRV